MEIVSGMARGVDKLAVQFANKNNLTLHKYPADWDTHGKAAGHIRNREMALNADALIAIWDGVSKGTKNMIDTANTLGLEVYVHIIEGDD